MQPWSKKFTRFLLHDPVSDSEDFSDGVAELDEVVVDQTRHGRTS
jgi:hypothetical protein